MPAFVVCVLGALENASFSLDQELTIGRDHANRVQILEVSISRRHCVIRQEGEDFVVIDLHSHNGTFVNGRPIEHHVLQPGDRISVGRSVFQFSLGTPVERSVAATVSFDDAPAPNLQNAPVSSVTQGNTNRLVRDFQALLKVTESIGRFSDPESLLWQLSGVIFEIVPAQRLAIMLGDTPEGLHTAIAWDRTKGPAAEICVSRTIVERTLQERTPVLINDVPKVVTSSSIEALHVNSVLCVPLATHDRLLGVMYLDSQELNPSFDDEHLHLMNAIASVVALGFENARTLESLRRENELLKTEVRAQFDMIGDSEPMQKLYRFIAKVAPTDSNVLIRGESGTGKELVARAIHRNSQRAEKPFVAINCAAIPDNLMESELFGYERGAFSGANAQKIGLLETADQGTIFLDEIGELALPLQAKLLRVLQEGEIRRLGGTRVIKVNVRVLAATNRNLPDFIKEGNFREDLYFRLNVLSCEIPPLRKRKEDIRLLADHFIEKYSKKCARRVAGIAKDALLCLQSYSWPGNVRELENAIERAVVLGSTDFLLRDDLPETLFDSDSDAVPYGYHEEVAKRKKELILDALKHSNGSFVDAAKLLGVHPNYLHRLVRLLDLRNVIDKNAS